jgi:hypothetical protein
MKRNTQITQVAAHEMRPSHSPLSFLLFMAALSALLCSSTARAQLAVATFDDYSGPFDTRQSYLVSNDGQTFEGVVMVKGNNATLIQKQTVPWK